MTLLLMTLAAMAGATIGVIAMAMARVSHQPDEDVIEAINEAKRVCQTRNGLTVTIGANTLMTLIGAARGEK